MLDEELIKEIRNDLPDIPRVFISSLRVRESLLKGYDLEST